VTEQDGLTPPLPVERNVPPPPLSLTLEEQEVQADQGGGEISQTVVLPQTSALSTEKNKRKKRGASLSVAQLPEELVPVFEGPGAVDLGIDDNPEGLVSLGETLSQMDSLHWSPCQNGINTH
jgi:hypothetical protein